MSIEENFNKRNSKLQQKIELEIEKVKVGQSKKNMVQLQTILTELQKSNMQKNVILSYPRIIVDSWDYSDQLGYWSCWNWKNCIENITVVLIYGVL